MFRDRTEAGKMLARALAKYREEKPVVLGLPRGGVVVAYQVAELLNAPLDIIVARKLGAPDQPELAIGAVVDGDQPVTVLNPEIIASYGITRAYLNEAIQEQLTEIGRRQRVYRNGHDPIPLQDCTLILVDDGIATGASIRAAIRGLRRKKIRRLVLAVPVAPPETVEALRPEVDDLVCLDTPRNFMAVGAHYEEFDQTSDKEVIDLLERARAFQKRNEDANGKRAAGVSR
ncbi:phosphoribosyltransferase [Candidatus Sumerlaeota bacterium]|nr:phosphoribosyltransferase [Candidatus Sumerlaeota bacterium]MBI3736066.1 phosphoribosyltransferase [Candidatus Sumerlaeota bacterium]